MPAHMHFLYVALALMFTIQSLAAPIVQPGSPGEASTALTAAEAIRIANTSFSADDVKFLQDMIPHHQQAVEMAALVRERTNTPEIVDVAGRITASQEDEINFMQDWLIDRGQATPARSDYHGMHTAHHMAGMASPEDMAKLATLSSTDFDRLFLKLMITHHDGALTMVDELLHQPGAAYDPVLYEFTNDVTNDQESEIERMHALLITLSDDPRAGLAAGFEDAGEAIHNLLLVGSLGKPDGFFDPENPAELPPEMPEGEEIIEEAPSDEGDTSTDATEDHAALDDHEGPEVKNETGDKTDNEITDEEEKKEAEEYDRYPLLGFSNTDMAFSGDLLFAGSYHGFNVYKLDQIDLPELTVSVVCPGGQGDVSIVGDILIMSVEETRGRLDCGLEGNAEDVSEERFMGLRIFDISDVTKPKQVGAVQTCRGSHTHSVVAADDKRIVVYNSGTSSVRDDEEMAGCTDLPGDIQTALFRIDVIEIPVKNPAASRILHSPTVFADPERDTLAGLWRGGDHGDEEEKTQDTYITDQCHDITVYPEKNLAAGACSGNGILFDISDPLDPKRLDVVLDKGFAYWHSATFNNDGTKVLFTDEWGGGGRPRCRAYDPLDWGADALYDIVDNKLEFRSHFKIPAPQVEEENCVAHNGSIVPVPGRDIFVQSWYQGGISLIDFTDTANPFEIAFFDRGPISDEHLIAGGYWSSYYYNGRIYGTEIVRGIDVFELLPSEHISEAEIAAAALTSDGDIFNPQQQMKVSWPNEPIVAQAYVDQLARSNALTAELVSDLSSALTSEVKKKTLRALAKKLPKSHPDSVTLQRLEALNKILTNI